MKYPTYKTHYILHWDFSVNTFCRRLSGYVTSNPKEVTCGSCRWVIMYAWRRKNRLGMPK
jgi:hypothetical protein